MCTASLKIVQSLNSVILRIYITVQQSFFEHVQPQLCKPYEHCTFIQEAFTMKSIMKPIYKHLMVRIRVVKTFMPQ